MEFTVPQFIEQETKIVGPLSFKQFAYLLMAGGISVFLYFTVPFGLFIFLSIIVFGIGFSLAILKIKGTPLPTLLKNLFVFLGRPKVYFWKKKAVIMKTTKKETILNEKEKESPRFKLVKKNTNLKDTLNKVAIK
ncbi:MAG: PrgI family protein [Candidatus Pacebacteria bacterium]|nr:PrgI family protein [Candidatus Paceibacterota bacterium]